MFAVVSVLLFAVAPVFAVSANHELDYCGPVQIPTLCNYTFGCSWDSVNVKCVSQAYYAEGLGTCAVEGNHVDPDPFGYLCYQDSTSYYIYDPEFYDSCNGDEYTTGTCPTYSSGSVKCHYVSVNDTDTSGSCYECAAGSTEAECACYDAGCLCDTNPWTANCYVDKTNAGICEGRNTYACSAIPFCHWNSSKCQPDWKCYYSYENSLYPNDVTCNNASDGPGCKSELIGSTTYCTSDTITATDEKCMLARADQATCEAAGCEWVPAGSTTTAGQFTAWCTEIGSGASVARVSSVLMVLLSIMLTFL